MDSRIGVTVRVRPLLESEKARNFTCQKLSVNPDSNTISLSIDDRSTRTFKFDKVIDETSDQIDFFDKNQIDSLISKVIEGYHSTIFAYGQTGSGKTFSMEGIDYETSLNNQSGDATRRPAGCGAVSPAAATASIAANAPKPQINFDKDNTNQGIIPRTIRRLYERVEAANRKNDRIYRVYVSYLQIYNEKIFDLLNTSEWPKKSDPLSAGQGLRLRWSKKEQFQVENLYVFECESSKEAFQLLAQGISNKVMASHKLNSQSSRSHSIFSLRVESVSKDDMENVICAKLHLVDLAGSERQALTGTDGINFKECVEINKSLFTLRQVITALAEQSTQLQSQYQQNTTTAISQSQASPTNAVAAAFSTSKHHNSFSNAATTSTQIGSAAPSTRLHVPYRDSKLTSLLKQSIGGSSYCLMIACLSPCDLYAEENLSTLQYATKAGQITNDPAKNEDPKSKLIKELKAKVHELTSNLTRANEHISFLSSFSTDNMNKYGSSLLKFSKPNPSTQLTPLRGQNAQQVHASSLHTGRATANSAIKTEQFLQLLPSDRERDRERERSRNLLLSSNRMMTAVTATPTKNIQKEEQAYFQSSNCNKQPPLSANDFNIDGSSFLTSDMIVKRLVDSANMVRDLLQSNMNLRETIDRHSRTTDQFETELAIIHRENSELREKIEIMESHFNMENNNNFERTQLKEESQLGDNQCVQQQQQQQPNVQTGTASKGSTKQPLSDLVNEVQCLRKQNKLLSSRLTELEIENSHLHFKINPKTLYSQPFATTSEHISQSSKQYQKQHNFDILENQRMNRSINYDENLNNNNNVLNSSSLDYKTEPTVQRGKKNPRSPLLNQSLNLGLSDLKNSDMISLSQIAVPKYQQPTRLQSYTQNQMQSKEPYLEPRFEQTLRSSSNNMVKQKKSKMHSQPGYVLPSEIKGAVAYREQTQLQTSNQNQNKYTNSIMRNASQQNRPRRRKTANYSSNGTVDDQISVFGGQEISQESSQFQNNNNNNLSDLRVSQVISSDMSSAAGLVFDEPQHSNFARSTWFNQQWAASKSQVEIAPEYTTTYESTPTNYNGMKLALPTQHHANRSHLRSLSMNQNQSNHHNAQPPQYESYLHETITTKKQKQTAKSYLQSYSVDATLAQISYQSNNQLSSPSIKQPSQYKQNASYKKRASNMY